MKFKDLFSTPKKIVTTLGISVISIGVLSSVSLFTVYAIAETNSVGKEAAVKNAYAAAGITESEVDAVDVDFKFKDGKFVYDVEFYSKGKEYEYKIRSKDGSIIDFEKPKVHNLPENTITIEKAKEIALTHAGLTEAEVTFTKAKLSRDDEAFEYEIEFKTSEKEYEYDISATNGEVKKAEIESIYTDDSQLDMENLIPVETAKEKALEHSGTNGAIFTKAALSRENGKYIYKINFTANSIEYKYQVNATDGTIIKSSQNQINLPDDTIISIEEAKNVVLSHGGLSADKAKFIKTELEKEDGVYIYEIEITYEGKKYSYDVNAYNGEIIKSESKEDFSPDSLIGTAKAKETALSHAGVSADEVVFEKSTLDKEDGKFVYEIVFKSQTSKFEYDIDAKTGEIIKNSKKDVASSPTLTPATDKETALEIALKDAGVTTPDHPHIFEIDKENNEIFYEI